MLMGVPAIARAYVRAQRSCWASEGCHFPPCHHADKGTVCTHVSQTAPLMDSFNDVMCCPCPCPYCCCHLTVSIVRPGEERAVQSTHHSLTFPRRGIGTGHPLRHHGSTPKVSQVRGHRCNSENQCIYASVRFRYGGASLNICICTYMYTCSSTCPTSCVV